MTLDGMFWLFLAGYYCYKCCFVRCRGLGVGLLVVDMVLGGSWIARIARIVGVVIVLLLVVDEVSCSC